LQGFLAYGHAIVENGLFDPRIAERKILARESGAEGEKDIVVLRASGFGFELIPTERSADSSPEIEFPGSVRCDPVLIVVELIQREAEIVGAVFELGVGPAAAELRKAFRAGDAQRSVGLVDPGESRADIRIVRLDAVHQVVESGIAVAFPPRATCCACGSGGSRAAKLCGCFRIPAFGRPAVDQGIAACEEEHARRHEETAGNNFRGIHGKKFQAVRTR